MLPLCTKDRKIVYVEQVYTSSTFYMKSAVPAVFAKKNLNLFHIKAVGSKYSL